MARRMLFEVAGERPGADLMEAPRTVPLPLALVGITVAALAEAMQVRAANEPPDHLGDVITTYAQTLSGFGQITAGAAPEQAGDPAEILFPPALLRRAARYISGAADLAANGGKLPDGIPETARNQLAATLRRDADGLIAIASHRLILMAASALSRSERPPTVTQRSSARYRHWPFRCCSSTAGAGRAAGIVPACARLRPNPGSAHSPDGTDPVYQVCGAAGRWRASVRPCCGAWGSCGRRPSVAAGCRGAGEAWGWPGIAGQEHRGQRGQRCGQGGGEHRLGRAEPPPPRAARSWLAGRTQHSGFIGGQRSQQRGPGRGGAGRPMAGFLASSRPVTGRAGRAARGAAPMPGRGRHGPAGRPGRPWCRRRTAAPR